ncbi:MAG: flavin reductase family protein [Thermoplasmata archaeon]|nr:flavin reductase family protein [Thermoplasmata archaeon]
MTSKQPMTAEKARDLFPCFPVALVTAGDNVASFGLMHVFSFKPPIIGIGVRRTRYTYEMIEKNKDFGINLPGKDLVEAVNICGRKSGRDVDKFQLAGLTRMAPSEINSVLVEECPMNIECKLHRKIEMPEASHDWLLGEIVTAHKNEGAVPEDALLYWNQMYRLIGDAVGKRE